MLAAKVLREVSDAPAADVAPVVHGRWIEKSATARKIYFECSHCGAQENKHTAILKEPKTNCLVYCRLEDVKEK